MRMIITVCMMKDIGVRGLNLCDLSSEEEVRHQTDLEQDEREEVEDE